MNTVYDIKVTECPIVVKDSITECWKTVPEFNITVKTSQYTLYVIRYIPDLLSFNRLIRIHYRKIKISFPRLTESTSKLEKRKSIRNFFHLSTKSNAEKLEKYLYRCALDPILRHSTLLRDFFSPQRDGDLKTLNSSHDYPSPTPSYDHPITTTVTNTTEEEDQVGKVWVPSPHPSIVSLPISRHSSFSTTSSSRSDRRSLKHSSLRSRRNSSIHKNLSIHHDNDHDDDDDDDDEVDELMKLVTTQAPQHEFPLDNLEMLKVLGKGCMGKVMLVRSRTTKELYALKSIVKEHVIEQREITHTLDERNILAKLSELDHPYLAKLHTSFQDEHRLYLLTNYYSGGDLATHMAKLYTFPKECALFYAAEIIDGIGELHRLGILYRDLKPENILLTSDGHIILTDFGLSKWLDRDATTQTFCGTAEYLAPEVLLGEPYSFGIDHWSFGTILYEMLAGITPFWADNHADMYRRVLEDPLEFPADLFDYETAEFLSDILDRDPGTRLGVDSIDEIKNHVYFADISWDDIRNRKLVPPYLPPVSDELDFTNFDPDFLAMTPQLTPISSEIEFTQEVQDIFDGYSFTDENFMDYEHSIYPARQSYHEDGFYDPPGLFQPARKRGSISMLSNVDSFCLDDDTLVKPSFARADSDTRYPKRRNTEDIPFNSTLVVINTTIPDTTTTTATTTTITNPLDDLAALDDFSKLPDLRLSFNIDRDSTTATTVPKSNSSNKSSSHQSKTRRFFSLLL